MEDQSEHEAYDYGLLIINEILRNDYNTSLNNIGGMPQSAINWVLHHPNPLIAKQFNWNLEDLMSIVNEHVPQLSWNKLLFIKNF